MLVISSAFSSTLITLFIAFIPGGLMLIGYGMWISKQNWETAILATLTYLVLLIMTIMSFVQYALD